MLNRDLSICNTDRRTASHRNSQLMRCTPGLNAFGDVVDIKFFRRTSCRLKSENHSFVFSPIQGTEMQVPIYLTFSDFIII